MTTALNQLGSGLFGFFGQLSMELAALAVLVFLIGRVLPIKSPALRHFLWLVVLLKPLVAVAISSPWTVFTPLVEPGWSALDHALLRVENLEATVAVPAATIGGNTAQLTLAGWVAALWIVSAALILGRILVGYSIVWRLRRQAQVQRRGPLFDALWQARLALGLEASAEVAISCSIRSPVVLGILRPLIVIPADLVDKLRADELELVLMHELAHVRRYDNFTLLLQRLITVVLFFHPAVWLCGYLLRREAEQACDDLVICSTGRSEDYARGLTNVAELAQLRNPLIRRIPVMNVFSATESDLALRIRRTLSGNARRMGTRSRILAAVLLCALAAATLPSSGIAQTRDGATADSDRRPGETRDDGVDWEAIRTTAPEEWSQELKDQLVAAGYDVEAIAERVRQGQAAAREGEAGDSDRGTRDGAAVDLDAIGRKIREAVARGELTAEEGRAKMEAARQAGEGNADKRHEKRIWQAAMETDPDEWSEELKAAILELKPDNTIEEIAGWVRQRRQATRVWNAAMATDPDEWSDRLKDAILALMPDSTIEEIAEGIRQRRQVARTKKDRASLDLDAIGRRIRAAIEAGELTPEEGRAKYEEAQRAAGESGDDRLREFQRGVIARAMAAAPEEWSDELKAAIVRAGWDLDDFTEGIRQRQAAGSNVTDLSQIIIDLTTSVEESSWGQVKKDVSEGE